MNSRNQSCLATDLILVIPVLRKRRLASHPAGPSVKILSAESFAAGTPPRGPHFYFADRLRDLRQRFVGKQLCLSYAVGCTVAAVSFWESGKRLPQRGTLSRILHALAHEGASNDELAHLRTSWKQAAVTRSHRPSSDYAPDSTRTL